MTETPGLYVTTPTARNAEPDPLAGLTNAERAVVLAMRKVNFGVGQSEHLLVVRWNGARAIVLDMRQI